MSNRFGRADDRNDLFSTYNRSASPSKSKNKAARSPYSAGAGYGYTSPAGGSSPGFGAYPGANGTASNSGGLYPGGSSYGGGRRSDEGERFRSATPNSRGQYSSAVLDELESQNDEQVGVLTSKVKMLKDVCRLFPLSPHPPLAVRPCMHRQLIECVVDTSHWR
ncbi:hypothetical protein NX059_001456 [Plenodomus lindquistii]|nr:hypothetical protein NX059_001456 [Plenodomus lindquistii]